MNIPMILRKILPDTEWMMEGNNYDDLVWLSKEYPKPLENELVTAWDTLLKEERVNEIREQRRLAYTTESDPIKYAMDEAYARGDTAKGDSLKIQWLSKKDEIRSRYPY